MFYTNKHLADTKQGRALLPVATWLLGWVMLFSSCNVTKHLNTAKGERLLVSNSLELKAERKMNFAERTPFLYQLESGPATYQKQVVAQG